MTLARRSTSLSGRRDGWGFAAALLLAAFALRMAVPLLFPGIHHPDEVYQSLEQAHRVVFGPGLVPWEFRSGARSWLLAGLLMPPMWTGGQLAPGTTAYLYLALAVPAAASATIPLVGYFWGCRLGRIHGALAALALLTWSELLHFGARALGEVVAGALLFGAVYLCSDRGSLGSTRRTLLAGALLGATVAFRFHLAPAVALSALWLARGELRRGWLPLLLGGTVPLALLGAVDWATWSMPFHSVAANFRFNILQGVSHIYGTSPWYAYLAEFLARWELGVLLLAACALAGARRQPLPLLVAIVIVLSHSFIAHKEYRFVYPALPLLVLCAAIGSAELCRWATRLPGPPSVRHALATFVALAWLAGSFAVARTEPSRTEWLRGNAGLEFLLRAGREARCGVALLGARWDMTGGYTALHRDLPLHLLYLDDQDDWDTDAFDAWIAPAGWLERMPLAARAGFERQQCRRQLAQGFEELCYWNRRNGACVRQSATEAQRVLEARGY